MQHQVMYVKYGPWSKYRQASAGMGDQDHLKVSIAGHVAKSEPFLQPISYWELDFQAT